MPRGEHFKKDNPRINQVSFKVNDSELVQLKEIAKKNNVSVAVWLRNQILGQPDITTEPIEEVAQDMAVTETSKHEVIEQPVKNTAIKKAKKYDQQENKNEQMSMF
jgi:hypothetical protein